MRPIVVSALKFGAVDPKRTLAVAGHKLIFYAEPCAGEGTYGGALGSSDILTA